MKGRCGREPKSTGKSRYLKGTRVKSLVRVDMVEGTREWNEIRTGNIVCPIRIHPLTHNFAFSGDELELRI